MSRYRALHPRLLAAAAFAALASLAAASCSLTPPDIEFAVGEPSWTNNQGDSTVYSIEFDTGVRAMPWDCSAIVSFDLYDLDGYVHAVATYVIDVEATVESAGWTIPFLQGDRRAFTVDLAEAAQDGAKGSASYTSRIRGIRAIVPRDVVFRPENSLLYPAWWRLPFEAVQAEAGLVYVADGLPD